MSASLVSSPPRFPRLLIAENNFSTTERLIRTFGDRRLDIDFDVCTTHGKAVRKLLASPYQLIIGGAHLAELDDFFFLKRAQTIQPFVPFVVTASASEKEAARRVLAQGAFDLISSPLDHEQTVRTIRLALWHGKLRNLIAQKEAALEQYRQHMAEYPDHREEIEESFNRTLLAFEKTIFSVARTIVRVEESSLRFSDFASNVECQIRKRALERLDSQSQMSSMTSLELHTFHETLLDDPRPDYLATLNKILQAAISITSADKGHIQILDPLSRTLRIVVHEGFAEPFLQFFKEVHHREAACGTALKRLERVIVEDVRESPIFAGTETLNVLIEAGVQAVQSTPLVTKSGCIVGMVSTHYPVPTCPTKEQLHLLDELAEIAAEFIGDTRVT